MAKVYMPHALIAALQSIKEKHPLNRSESRGLSDAELNQLLKRIEETPEKSLKALAMTLTQKENDSLAKYFPENRFSKDLAKVAVVLYENMDPTIFGILFVGWQNFPMSRHLIDLLAESDLPGKRDEKCPLPVGFIENWYGQSYEYVIAGVTDYILKGARENQFLSVYQEKGFQPNRLLGVLCGSEYLAKGRRTELQRESESFICRCIQDNPVQKRADAVRLNILEQYNSDRKKLDAYPNLFKLMQKRYGEPDSRRFPIGHPTAFETYRWWFNYRQLVEGFSSDMDFRRLSFWEKYMNHCMVSRIRQSRFLILEFSNYVVVESEVVGYLYIFKKDYFESTVVVKLRLETESDGKRWMRYLASSQYSKMHSGYWENEVAAKIKQLGMI